ncbi:FtsX-like permease family protein [Candidatus Uhrbacteria bacterium]|nr:MAG: FtsX-like permease family protein [Candidatus Uhrbacteria bacterium]
MRLRDTCSIAVSSLRRTRGRAVLTMLGIVIGIASVILMLSIGRAVETFIVSQVSQFGADLVIVVGGRGDLRRSDPTSVLLAKPSLTVRDYRELRRQEWTRAVDAATVATDVVGYAGTNRFTTVYGTVPDVLEILNMRVARGRFLSDEDVDARSRTIVLGHLLARRLFGVEDPIGKQVRISRRNFRVVGVLEPSGARYLINLDDLVYIPTTAAMDLYNRDHIFRIIFKPAEGISMRDARERVRLLLRDTHKLDNPAGDLAKDDFRVLTQEDIAETANTIGLILQILLASIAAISLIVGGVGIMNIMYVTVTERTSEIGLRKALGARREDILGQFLVEAVLLTGAGGIVGILAGIGLTYLAVRIISLFQSGIAFEIHAGAVLLAVTVSAVIGVVFGYFPARRAAALDPIEALRYE